MRDFGATNIGYGTAALAVVFGAGLLFWGTIYARFRRTTLIAIGVAAFVVVGLDVLVVNHLGQNPSAQLLLGLVGVGVGAIFFMSGATPAALGLLADVSEGFEEDRSAIMGLYSVFLGVGQVIGAIVGAVAASWKGIDGLIVATAGLLLIGILFLLNLRAHEEAILAEQAGAATPVSIRDSTRATLGGSGGGRQGSAEAAAKEE
jgi:MFS family permease